MTGEAIIEVRNLVNRFGAQTVHQDLALDLYRGEVLGVVGGSGTGKSVLLRSILGPRRANSGTVRVFGEELLSLAPEQRSQLERRFGVLYQRGALFSSLTVTENIALLLIEHAGLTRAAAERLAQVKLALVGLPREAGDKYPTELSGGMIKRAALGRALALEPDILFLDEPTAGLDPIGAAAFDQLILTLRDALGLSVFWLPTTLTPSTPSVIGWPYWQKNAYWWPTAWTSWPPPTTLGYTSIFTARADAQPNRPPTARQGATEWNRVPTTYLLACLPY